MQLIKFNIIIFIILINLSFGQSLSVVAGMNEQNKVTVRWFSNHVFNVEGVNIYRRELPSNEWKKLNQVPIKRADDVSKTSKDTMLIYYSVLTYNKPSNPEDEGIWKIAILTNGILDSKFSEFYGMQFMDREVIMNKTYEYKVVKIENGRETGGSTSNQVKIEPFKKPDAPANFKAIEGDGKAQFNWEHNKKKFFAYNIYRSEKTQEPKSKINKLPIVVFGFRDATGKLVIPENLFQDTALVNGREYYYELTGIDFLGRESLPTKEIKVIPRDKTPPSEAYNLKTVFQSDTVTITWELEPDNDLKEINVYRSKKSDGPFEKLNPKPLSKETKIYRDPIKIYEPIYFYVIETVDFSGNFTRTFPKASLIPDLKPPAQPKNLSATGEVGRVILKWDKNTEPDLLGYFIMRSISGKEDDFLLLNPEPFQSNVFIDTLTKELSNLITYKIKAVDNSYNESEYSNSVKVKMKDVTPPMKPILLTVTSEEEDVKFEWLPNAEGDLLGYNIFVSNSDSSSPFKKLNQKPVKGTSFVDKIKISGNYKSYITAEDTSGNISVNSDTLDFSVIVTEIIKPNLNLTGYYDTTKSLTSLRWNSVKEALGYVIFRRELNEELSEAVSELIQTNSFDDPGGASEKFYYFIRVFFNDGNTYDSEEILPK
ncbi:MAG: hypothetical protein N2319_05085 [Candidatus Kapabacteria bacterium]|nr:hypothetical protein [Candidatus Kapabacteria bacterium]